MKQRPGLRLFVVSDRKDKFVSYRSQLEFVERVKAHNLPITHVTATATDKDSHGLFAHGHRLAVDCAKIRSARATVLKIPVASPAKPRGSSTTQSRSTRRDPSDRQGKRFVGSAIWRTEMVSPGPDLPPDPAVRADIEIPERRTTMTLFIRRDLKQVQRASHTIEITVQPAGRLPFGGIANVPGVLMKQAEQTRGSPLGGLPRRSPRTTS